MTANKIMHEVFIFALLKNPTDTDCQPGCVSADTREMQSLCAFLFRGIKSVDVYRKIHTNTAIYMSFD